jgi:hypothetical protein
LLARRIGDYCAVFCTSGTIGMNRQKKANMSSMSNVEEPVVETKSNDEPDLVWGAHAIGEVINRKPAQVYHLIEVGALKGAVRKVGHKTLVGSRRELLRLPLGESK